MGFVQFPASETEPAKSGPGAANRLAHVYKEYIFPFDHLYISSVLQSRRKMQAVATQPTAATASPTTARNQPTPQQMTAMITYAFTPTEELRQMGLADKMIQFIEAHREQLQTSANMSVNYRSGLLSTKSTSTQSGSSQESQERRPPSTALPFPSLQNPIHHPSIQHTRHGPFMQQQNMIPPSLGNSSNVEPQYSRPPQPPQMNVMLTALSRRISPEQLQQTQAFIQKTRTEFAARSQCFTGISY